MTHSAEDEGDALGLKLGNADTPGIEEGVGEKSCLVGLPDLTVGISEALERVAGIEGFCDGTLLLGNTESLGIDDGDKLGAPEGSRLGKSVGERLGMDNGSALTLVLCELVGFAMAGAWRIVGRCLTEGSEQG